MQKKKARDVMYKIQVRDVTYKSHKEKKYSKTPYKRNTNAKDKAGDIMQKV